MAGQAGMQQIAERIVARVGRRIVVGLPLGLGKPNRLINALYALARKDSGIHLEIVTALSLDIPQGRHWLQARLLKPITERHFGADYPRLDYLTDVQRQRLPGNVQVTEFYVQSGTALGNATRQRHYIASNYTHVARDLADRGVNLLLQLVARDADGRLSLACNPDVTLDLVRRLRADGRPLHAVAQVHPDLPFLHGDAIVGADFFDEVIHDDPAQPLFPLLRQPVSLQDYAVGLHAGRLIADGGTLQIGIGSLSDAVVHGLLLRHRDNARYRRILAALGRPAPAGIGDEGVFQQGLFGASEMFMDAFMHLYQAGILTREVFDDPALMADANAGRAVAQAGQGALMEAGFFLGSPRFYDFLRNLDAAERPRFRMHGVSRINQLYGGNEALEIAQRRRARFLNTCMMMTATGAAVSDGLENHQVVSGVGGQYNFVAMAHAMDDGRSILMLRASREAAGTRQSNILWQYPHSTIPRHLRDLVVTEYGIADLRGRTDEQCIQAMLQITDSAFQDELAETAKRAGKLDPGWQIPETAKDNHADALASTLAPFIEDGDFPEYPFGSDFTALEERLIPALAQVKDWSASRGALLAAVLRGRPARYPEELTRLGLDRPRRLNERLYARLVAAALAGE